MTSVKSWSDAALTYIPTKRRYYLRKKAREGSFTAVTVRNQCEAFFLNEKVLEAAIKGSGTAQQSIPIPFNPSDPFPTSKLEFDQMEVEYQKQRQQSTKIPVAKKNLDLLTHFDQPSGSCQGEQDLKPPSNMVEDYTPEELMKLIDDHGDMDYSWDETDADELLVR